MNIEGTVTGGQMEGHPSVQYKMLNPAVEKYFTTGKIQGKGMFSHSKVCSMVKTVLNSRGFYQGDELLFPFPLKDVSVHEFFHQCASVCVCVCVCVYVCVYIYIYIYI